MITVKIDTATSGSNTLVAADTNRRIRVLSYHLVVASAVTVKFIGGAADLTGVMSFAANGGIALSSGHPDIPLLQTAKNEALIISLGGNVQVSGSVTYDLVR